jgi:hypothetical protein
VFQYSVKKFFTYAISMLLSAMMLAAVGGISVIHQYCGCNAEVTSSLFFEDECCDHHDEMATTCCSSGQMEPTCCSSGQAEEGCNGSCCQTDNEFIRLTDSFTAPARQDINDLSPVTVELPASFTLIEDIVDEDTEGFLIDWDSSPPPSSVKIRSFLSRLTLSPPSVA